ncbi:Craniofacial development protein 1 [Lamellibrachia satsuma]|nr:Craniofacial development protein 1 [Lamellibrachia satsuma]
MTTIEEFSSDSDDEDYIPGVEEAVSEDEQSGVDEDLLHSEHAADGTKVNKAKVKKKRKKDTANVLEVRKRKGGIKLDEEVENESNKQDDDDTTDSNNTQLSEEIQKEKEEKKALEKKQRVDALWADFLKDTSPPSQPKSRSGLGSLTTQSKSATTTQNKTEMLTAGPTVSSSNSKLAGKPAKVTITQEFDFAGETVKITKEVDVNSKEAKQSDQKDTSGSKTSPAALSGVKRPGGGLGSLLGKLGKKPKISTLEKSQLDWNKFKQQEGLEEELQVHNRGKEGYLERQAFLSRADQRQYELEKSVRLGLSKR